MANKFHYGKALGIAVIAILFAGTFVVVGMPWLQSMFGVNPPQTEITYKTITVTGSCVGLNGAAVAATGTNTYFAADGTVIAGGAVGAAGTFSTNVASGEDYYLFFNFAATLQPDLTFHVSVPAVTEDSEITTWAYSTAFTCPAGAATYTLSVSAGGVTNSLSNGGTPSTTPTDYPVTATVDVDMSFQVANTDDYSVWSLEWFNPLYGLSTVNGYWVIASNTTFVVKSSPSAYAYYALGSGNFSFVFQGNVVTTGAAGVTDTMVVTLNFPTNVGSPSWDVYYVWNTTLNTLSSSLYGQPTTTHLTTAPTPTGYGVGGLFHVLDGSYAQINTT